MARPLQRVAGLLPRENVNTLKRSIGRGVAWNLDWLAILWGTDKASDGHGYTRHYQHHLHGERRTIRNVLEIGIGDGAYPDAGGHSLRMWRSYFPHATIYGVDLYEKRITDTRIVTLQADQSDRASLQRVLDVCPQFDLIVDDGSHVGSHILTSFEVLFPAVRPGGHYAIEDLETAYWPQYGGGPPGTRGTAISLAKSLIDDANVGPLPVAAVSAYRGLVIIQRANG